MSTDVVRAAGAVLWRLDGRNPAPAGSGGDADAEGERRLIAVIHRPRYDDWTLPKGKLDPGEDDAQAALREVEEETGQRGEILRDLGEIRYRATKRGRTFDKVVRYYEMQVAAPGKFVPDDEVDDLRWMPAAEALTALSYDRDAEVLRRYDPTL